VEDWVTAVNGTSIDNGAFYTPAAERSAWQVGNTVQYTVQRDGQAVTIEVFLVRWQVGKLLQTAVFPI
jgi:S1-C subfamily serine protease